MLDDTTEAAAAATMNNLDPIEKMDDPVLLDHFFLIRIGKLQTPKLYAFAENGKKWPLVSQSCPSIFGDAKRGNGRLRNEKALCFDTLP